MPGAHRLTDILQGLLADVVEGNIHLAANLPMGVVGDADAARLGDSLQARRDVDAVAENIVVVEDDVADVDADAKLDPQVGRHVDIPLRHRALHFHRIASRIHGTGELDQHAVARGLDDAPVVRLDAGIDQGLAQHFQLRQRPLLVATHQPAIAGDISRQHRRQSPVHALVGQKEPPPLAIRARPGASTPRVMSADMAQFTLPGNSVRI